MQGTKFLYKEKCLWLFFIKKLKFSLYLCPCIQKEKHLNLEQIHSKNFEKKALDLFRFQAKNNKIYAEYLKHLAIDSNGIKSIEKIPFLPIHFFKTHAILSSKNKVQKTFLSSGTSQNQRSQHFVTDIGLYEQSFTKGFHFFYGNFQDYCIQALLPSYIEQGNSSLIYMVDYFIRHSKNKLSAFVTEKELLANISLLKNKKVLLIGVSYALLDLAEKQNIDLSHYTIMETGGMKGRRKEWTREELHRVLKKSFNVSAIHSEYGMTELLSQAYSKGNGLFACPPWLKVMARPMAEPFGVSPVGQSGILKIIDLANVNSCAFIETADLGKVHANGNFEVLGRVDFAEIRGCNLMLND